MTDFSAFRPFSIEAVVPEGWGALGGPLDLICACQMKHQGWTGRPGNAGALALASWIMDHRDQVALPKAGTHPLNSGTAIERILAGEVLPEEDFAMALAAATDGAVLPKMFGQPEPEGLEKNKETSTQSAPGVDGEAPESQQTPNMAAVPAPSEDRAPALPPLGALGGHLPPGRLFHPIADSRFPQGFVLTGCGMALCLDESTATAMQAAIAAGLDHLRQVRSGGRRIAA
ncbi:hypothetical protein SAMN02927924_02795 [Sphingobium faniae]|nr:hypothetical protein SAMN02927924_02795 [Sphingobium faniae]